MCSLFVRTLVGDLVALPRLSLPVQETELHAALRAALPELSITERYTLLYPTPETECASLSDGDCISVIIHQALQPRIVVVEWIRASNPTPPQTIVQCLKYHAYWFDPDTEKKDPQSPSLTFLYDPKLQAFGYDREENRPEPPAYSTLGLFLERTSLSEKASAFEAIWSPPMPWKMPMTCPMRAVIEVSFGEPVVRDVYEVSRKPICFPMIYVEFTIKNEYTHQMRFHLMRLGYDPEQGAWYPSNQMCTYLLPKVYSDGAGLLCSVRVQKGMQKDPMEFMWKIIQDEIETNQSYKGGHYLSEEDTAHFRELCVNAAKVWIETVASTMDIQPLAAAMTEDINQSIRKKTERCDDELNKMYGAQWES